MQNHESMGNRFKIWRSRQSYFVNVIIDWALFLKDMLLIILMAAAFCAVIGIIVLLMVQAAGNAYSGH